MGENTRSNYKPYKQTMNFIKCVVAVFCLFATVQGAGVVDQAKCKALCLAYDNVGATGLTGSLLAAAKAGAKVAAEAAGATFTGDKCSCTAAPTGSSTAVTPAV